MTRPALVARRRDILRGVGVVDRCCQLCPNSSSGFAGPITFPFHSISCLAMAQQDDILDSLPYYDDDLQKYPFLKDKVEQEIARELGKVPTSLHPRVPPDVELFAVREHHTGRVINCL